MSRPTVPAVAALLGLVATGCATHRLRLDPPPQGAQALSLLGDTLWTVRFGHVEAQERVSRLVAAQRRAMAQPGNDAATILLGRRTAEMGRYREALEIYSERLEETQGDARVYRRRGELLLLLREPDLAVKELKRAVSWAARRPGQREFTATEEGEFAGVDVLHSSLLLLGIAYHIQADTGAAVTALSESVRAATEPDEMAPAALWLYLALRRAGRPLEAAAILRALPADLGVSERRAELRLILALRGDLPLDSIRREIASQADPSAEPLYLYGLAVVLEAAGQAEESRNLLERIHDTGRWGELPAVAAEADLARLAAPCPGPLPALPHERRWRRCPGGG